MTSAAEPLRVLIVDDEPLARLRLRQLVEALPDAAVAGEAGDADAALALLDAAPVDVVLLDVRMPGRDGLRLAEALREPAVPPAVWLDTLAARVPNVAPATAPPVRAPLLVLSAPAFAEAVQEALRDYGRPHRLSQSPLLRSRLVVERTGSEPEEPDSVAALRGLLREATDALDATPREAPYARAVRATYFEPAATQALTAEGLGVPFSTYRRHLTRGAERVAEALWRLETAH